MVFICLHVLLFCCVPAMARKTGKRCNRGRRTHRRSRAAGGECGWGALDRALCGLLARRPLRRVLLASAAKIFFHVDIPEPLAPAELRDVACDIARRLHGEPTQAFHPEGTLDVKPVGQHHMCSHKFSPIYACLALT